jgi:amino acid permease
MAGDAAEGTASAMSVVFNLCNVAIGAGVLSFPLAFRLTGPHINLIINIFGLLDSDMGHLFLIS